MRSDMARVIVERPRVGGVKLRREKIPRDDELALSNVGVRRHARIRGGWKGLNENLAPLRRYLERQVGRPWDEVWSEICANLKPTSTVQQHVRDHVPDFVAIKTSLRDGTIWVHDRFSPRLLKETHTRLYVDPATGVLRRNERNAAWRKTWRQAQKAREAAICARMRVVSRTKQLHLFGECWWEVTLAGGYPASLRLNPHLPHAWQVVVEPDVVRRAALSQLPREELYGRAGVYAVAKRQLSKKEMRDLGLPRPH
jgi:hypothetical protein